MNILDITKQIRVFADQLESQNAPESEKPDPYAALKKAHAEGKVIEVFVKDDEYGPDRWSKKESDGWPLPPERYRIKPEAPPFQLPPPPPGMQWHRTDGWQEGDLPIGYRPHALGEEVDGEGKDKSDGIWYTLGTSLAAKPDHIQLRTTRPLTFTHAGKQWTWHRPGDPRPCERDRLVTTLLEDGEIGGTGIKAYKYDWNIREDEEQIIGWRYADEKKTVPLAPEDVPPGSVFRGAGEAKDPDDKGWCLITSCSRTGIRYWRHSDSDPAELSWKTIHESGAQINRSLPFTGKWNPDAWEPCSKEVDA